MVRGKAEDLSVWKHGHDDGGFSPIRMEGVSPLASVSKRKAKGKVEFPRTASGDAFDFAQSRFQTDWNGFRQLRGEADGNSSSDDEVVQLPALALGKPALGGRSKR